MQEVEEKDREEQVEVEREMRALCASSAHDVHHASVCVNVVISVLVVLCELHVQRPESP